MKFKLTLQVDGEEELYYSEVDVDETLLNLFPTSKTLYLVQEGIPHLHAMFLERESVQKD